MQSFLSLPNFLRRHSTEKRPQEEALVEWEQKCIFIMACLKNLMFQELQEDEKQQEQSAHEADDVLVMPGFSFLTLQSSAAEDVAEFDRLLILKSREFAVLAGEKMILKRLTAAGKKINFPASYAASNAARAAIIEKQLELQSHEITPDAATANLGEIAYIMAEAGALSMLDDLLNCMKSQFLILNKKESNRIFFKVLRFGHAPLIEQLLKLNVDPNCINTDHPFGCYRPLNLVIEDLGRFLGNMCELILAAKSDNDLRYGTDKELLEYFNQRISAYISIVRSLIKKGANPDLGPSKTVQAAKHARQLANTQMMSLLEDVPGEEPDRELLQHFKTCQIRVLSLIADSALEPRTKQITDNRNRMRR